MIIYIAGRYSRKEELRQFADRLNEEGFCVSSSWLEEPHNPQVSLADVHDSAEGLAKTDIQDILGSDVMVFFAEDPNVGTPRGGRHFEMGYAYGMSIPIIVCPQKENIFHYLEDVTVCEDEDSVIATLKLMEGKA